MKDESWMELINSRFTNAKNHSFSLFSPVRALLEIIPFPQCKINIQTLKNFFFPSTLLFSKLISIFYKNCVLYGTFIHAFEYTEFHHTFVLKQEASISFYIYLSLTERWCVWFSVLFNSFSLAIIRLYNLCFIIAAVLCI